MAGPTSPTATGFDPVPAWERCGGSGLSGPAPGGLLGPPERLVPGVTGTGGRIEGIAASWGRPLDVDWLGLLVERAAIEGLTPRGRTSCGGATRLLECADGWVAVSLARPTDLEVVPAWLALAGDPGPRPGGADAVVGADGRTVVAEGLWDAVAAAVRGLPGAGMAAAAGLVGLPVGVLGERSAEPDGGVAVQELGSVRAGTGPPRLVVDLSTLWAGPLCASLLGACGAEVVKVTSVGRPDGAANGDAAWYRRLNGAKHHLELDLGRARDRDHLAGLVAEADVVVESARPRGLEQLGIVAADVLAGRSGPRAWVSITGHGRASARVAFGDDAAVAGGLVVRDVDGPWFCGDAVADPLSGIAATAAALRCLATGRRALVDVAMAGVAAAHAGPTVPVASRVLPGSTGT